MSHRYAATALLIALASIPAAAEQPRPVACPLEIVGTWKATAAEPRLLSFSSDGWANVLGSTGEHRPSELELLAQVQYEFAARRQPRRIGFRARRGNDIFPSGSSSWEITAHTDESFSARSTSDEAGEQSHWTRVQTHRYFLTFAARGDSALFVMWTTLDGSTAVYESLGATTTGFGRIPQELTAAFVKQSDRNDEAMMRVELNEAEYRRTHQVFVSWDTLVRRGLLAREDAWQQALLLMDATLQGVNRCGTRLRTVREPAPRPLDFVREIRKLNDRAHLPDKSFPFRWTPPPAI